MKSVSGTLPPPATIALLHIGQADMRVTTRAFLGNRQKAAMRTSRSKTTHLVFAPGKEADLFQKLRYKWPYSLARLFMKSSLNLLCRALDHSMFLNAIYGPVNWLFESAGEQANSAR